MKKILLPDPFLLMLLITLSMGCKSYMAKKYEPTWESLKIK